MKRGGQLSEGFAVKAEMATSDLPLVEMSNFESENKSDNMLAEYMCTMRGRVARVCRN
jgi:hypothetical protein